jgi:hypothetical protein
MMKRAVLLLALLSLAAIPNTPQPVTLAWDPYPAASTDMVFKLYHSVDLAIPLSAWQVMTGVAGSSTQVTVNIMPGPHFFFLTASNFWGESDASNIALTPTVPRLTNTVTIRKGP